MDANSVNEEEEGGASVGPAPSDPPAPPPLPPSPTPETNHIPNGTDSTATAPNNNSSSSSSASGRKRSSIKQYNSVQENTALDLITKEAEARFEARRAARARAREMRLKELEKKKTKQKDEEDPDECDNDSGAVTPTTSSTSGKPRETSPDSFDEAHDSKVYTEHDNDLKERLHVLEEKYKREVLNAYQNESERAALLYQVDSLKDDLVSLKENHRCLTKDHRGKCRELEQLKRVSNRLKDDNATMRREVQEVMGLIKEAGLVIVMSSTELTSEGRPRKVLLSQANAEAIEAMGENLSLEQRLRKLMQERDELLDRLGRTDLALEEERGRTKRFLTQLGGDPDGCSDPEEWIRGQRETLRSVNEYKAKIQRSEQDIATLQASVARLEGQLGRSRSAAETAEKNEEELRQEKRKLQRELKDAQERIEELETSNSHLQKRFDKLKNARSTLLKELSESSPGPE